MSPVIIWVALDLSVVVASPGSPWSCPSQLTKAGESSSKVFVKGHEKAGKLNCTVPNVT